jgi:hypothetical protein
VTSEMVSMADFYHRPVQRAQADRVFMCVSPSLYVLQVGIQGAAPGLCSSQLA